MTDFWIGYAAGLATLPALLLLAVCALYGAVAIAVLTYGRRTHG